MTRRRWIADEFSAAGHWAAITGANAAHLARVLRARVGQEFEIAAESGESPQVFLGRVSSVTPDRVEFELLQPVSTAAPLPLVILLSVFKFDRMEWALEKLTELGVSEIVPVIAQRTEKHLAQATGKRHERWQRIVHEAAQQARRAASPVMHEPALFKHSLQMPFESRIVLMEAGERAPLRSVIAQHRASAIALAVGPEGGWSPSETKQFQEAGWRAASLGATILRAETAAIAATAIAMAELEGSAASAQP